MKLTLNALQYRQNSSGIGQLIYNLYNSLIEEIEKTKKDVSVDIIVSKGSPALLSGDGPGRMHGGFVKIKEAPFRKSENIKRNLYELSLLRRDVDRTSDVFVSLDGKLPLFLPSNIKKIVGVTDMAVYRMGGVYQASRTLYWKPLFSRSIKTADRVVAISEFTKNEIVDITGVKPEKVDVVYCGVGRNFSVIDDTRLLTEVRKKYGLDGPFILFVGTFSPRKNLLRLIKAFEIAKGRYSIPHRLVIVGEKGWKFDRDSQRIRESSIAGSIAFPGYISDEDLPAIYNLADLTVYPSVYEGFGLPVVESMACGTPVALSGSSCLPEIAGEAGVYFDPYNVEDIAEKIYRLSSDTQLRGRMIALGLEQARKYSWSKAAGELLRIAENLSRPERSGA